MLVWGLSQVSKLNVGVGTGLGQVTFELRVAGSERVNWAEQSWGCPRQGAKARPEGSA